MLSIDVSPALNKRKMDVGVHQSIIRGMRVHSSIIGEYESPVLNKRIMKVQS